MTTPIQGPYGGGSGITQWRQAQFQKADTDSNGTLSKTELIKSLQSHLPDDADAASIADKLLSKLDSDGDGSISKTEFVSGRPKFDQGTGTALLSAQEAPDQTADTDPAQLASQFLSKYDTNQDGSLTSDELTSSLGGTDLSAQLATNIIKLFDQNGDGSVSADEVAAKLAEENPATADAAQAAQNQTAQDQPRQADAAPSPSEGHGHHHGSHGPGQGRLGTTVVDYLLQTQSQAEAA
jgi:Ca2+-binding EF-hand superfamily protein